MWGVVMKVSSTELQNNFGKYLKFAEANEEIIVTRNGRDIARLVCIEQSDRVKEGAAEYRTRGEWVTYEEFLDLVEQSDQRFELIDGVVYNLASPSYKHQHAVHELHGAFYNWFKGKSCKPLTSPFDVTIQKEENNICVVQPDILVICDRENINDIGQYKGVPALVVEVLSLSTRTKDLVKKLELYMQCGVKEYWIVDPMNQQVQVYELDDQNISNMQTYKGNVSAESFLFEGLSVPLNDMFPA
jgi:prevent-host-death family protein